MFDTVSQETVRFDLNQLHKLCPSLTKKWADYVSEASAFCLELHNHVPSISMIVSGKVKTKIDLEWEKLPEEAYTTYSDLQDATEDGAVGIACGLINLLTEGKLKVIERSFKGTGFDYWIGENNSESLFQDKLKLEISGVLEGTFKEVSYRTSNKLEQINRTSKELEGYVIVVEFSHPYSEVIKDEQ